MAIRDLKGREVRIQLSADKKVLDLYLGPEKVRHRSKEIRWWTAHRRFEGMNAKRFAEKFAQVTKRLK